LKQVEFTLDSHYGLKQVEYSSAEKQHVAIVVQWKTFMNKGLSLLGVRFLDDKVTACSDIY